MNRRDTVLTIPAAIAAVALKLKANPTPTGPLAPVTQAELKRVGTLWDESEALAADIRRRLEAGAELEPGELGVATWGQDAVNVTATGGGGGGISIGGIEIEPVDHLRQVRGEYPEFANEIWA